MKMNITYLFLLSISSYCSLLISGEESPLVFTDGIKRPLAPEDISRSRPLRHPRYYNPEKLIKIIPRDSESTLPRPEESLNDVISADTKIATMDPELPTDEDLEVQKMITLRENGYLPLAPAAGDILAYEHSTTPRIKTDFYEARKEEFLSSNAQYRKRKRIIENWEFEVKTKKEVLSFLKEEEQEYEVLRAKIEDFISEKRIPTPAEMRTLFPAEVAQTLLDFKAKIDSFSLLKKEDQENYVASVTFHTVMEEFYKQEKEQDSRLQRIRKYEQELSKLENLIEWGTKEISNLKNDDDE